MLFHASMTVNRPQDMAERTAETLKAAERERAAELQRQGKWQHLWRVAGRYANVSIFEVEDADQLLLASLPLFPFMEVQVTALGRHPSSIRDGDT